MKMRFLIAIAFWIGAMTEFDGALAGAGTSRTPSPLLWVSVDVGTGIWNGNSTSYNRTLVAQIPEGYLVKTFGPGGFAVTFVPDPQHSWQLPITVETPAEPIFDGVMLHLTAPGQSDYTLIRWDTVASLQDANGKTSISIISGQSITVNERVGLIEAAVMAH
jgi:hypothetical protein